MRNSVALYQQAPVVTMQKSPEVQNSATEVIPAAEVGKAEWDEVTKPKVTDEKGATLVHLMWGDNFLSDSLH